MSAHELADVQYVALTTFRRDGTAVATPVWIAALEADDGPELVAITLADTWKVTRVRRDSRVQVQECDVRGRVRPGAPTYEGVARVVDDAGELARVRSAMSRKYPLARVGNTLEDALGGLMRRKPRVGIAVTELAVVPQR